MLMEVNQLSSQIIKAAITVHKELGPALLESVYRACMVMELNSMSIKVRSEVPLPVYYRGQKIDDQGFRLHLLVEDTIIVELKSVQRVEPVHKNSCFLTCGWLISGWSC